MKKLLILFGVLDIIILVRYYRDLTNFNVLWGEWHWITVATSLFFLSLVFSSYYLIKTHKIGLWLTYGQFPFRLIFLVFSFGFIASALRIFELRHLHRSMLWGLVVLEILRLLITINIHRKVGFR